MSFTTCPNCHGFYEDEASVEQYLTSKYSEKQLEKALEEAAAAEQMTADLRRRLGHEPISCTEHFWSDLALVFEQRAERAVESRS